MTYSATEYLLQFREVKTGALASEIIAISLPRAVFGLPNLLLLIRRLRNLLPRG